MNMIYVAVETIMGGAGRVHHHSRDEDEIWEYIKEDRLDLSIEALTEEQYKMVVNNHGYIKEDWF
jgi:hypothetical protein